MVPLSRHVQDLLKLAASPAAMLHLAPDLRITAAVTIPRALARARDATERAWLAHEGIATLPEAADAKLCVALLGAVEQLRENELPAVFVYAFDEPWAIGEQLRQRIAAQVGREYRLVEDVWAWRIAPASGGWPPHRGIVDVRLDREAPEVLNVWVALSDVTAERACMHAVPLDADPSYPDALANVDAPLTAVRALPVSAGDALFWNANVLHWGGRCAEHAAGPRVSCSFTLCRADATDRFPDLRLLPPLEELDFAARMDALARMIVIYGSGQADVSGVVREWATLTHELTSRFGGRAGERKAP